MLVAPGMIAGFRDLLKRMGIGRGGRLAGRRIFGGECHGHLAANVTTLPLVVYYFGRLSVVSLLTNVLILPVQPPIMLAGSAGVLAGMAGLDLPGQGSCGRRGWGWCGRWPSCRRRPACPAPAGRSRLSAVGDARRLRSALCPALAAPCGGWAQRLTGWARIDLVARIGAPSLRPDCADDGGRRADLGRGGRAARWPVACLVSRHRPGRRHPDPDAQGRRVLIDGGASPQAALQRVGRGNALLGSRPSTWRC
jgi:hypothetical protein